MAVTLREALDRAGGPFYTADDEVLIRKAAHQLLAGRRVVAWETDDREGRALGWFPEPGEYLVIPADLTEDTE